MDLVDALFFSVPGIGAPVVDGFIAPRFKYPGVGAPVFSGVGRCRCGC